MAVADFDDSDDLPTDVDDDVFDGLDDDLEGVLAGDDFDLGESSDDDVDEDDADPLAGLGLEELEEDEADESLDDLDVDGLDEDDEDERRVRDGTSTALVEGDDDELLDTVDADAVAPSRTLDVDDEVREGEFVCRSCFMAKRESALADEDRLLCRDCV